MSAFAKLTTQHQLVISHYRANGRDMRSAWIAAGYAVPSANASSSRFFARADVQAALAELDGVVFTKLKVDAEEVLERLAHIMRGNMADFVIVDDAGKASLDLKEVTRAQWAAVSQIKLGVDGAVTLKLYDARAAAVDIGKHLGLWTGFGGGPDDSNETVRSPLESAMRIAFLLSQGVQLAEGKLPKPLH